MAISTTNQAKRVGERLGDQLRPKPAVASIGMSDLLREAMGHRASDFVPPEPKRRDRLWELSTNLHCSIIGTCLSTSDLRALLAKLGDPSARSASDHALHGQAVLRAGRKDEGGKLLHKLLDRRHERQIARFGCARHVDDLRDLWREAVEHGDIPGAYWAVLTHPSTDRVLVQETFGEVHMLSHLVGRSVRADLSRLSEVEAQLDIKEDALNDLRARVQALTREKIELAAQLSAHVASGTSTTDVRAAECAPEPLELLVSRLQERLHRADAHASAEAARREEAERALRALTEDVHRGARRENAIQAECDALQAALSEQLSEDAERTPLRLTGRKILYVGGRPAQVVQARRFVQSRGGTLASHDGGIEDSPAMLPGLVAQAEAVFFPADCVSHDAVTTLKRTCRDKGRPYVPLRSASLASFIAALDRPNT